MDEKSVPGTQIILLVTSIALILMFLLPTYFYWSLSILSYRSRTACDRFPSHKKLLGIIQLCLFIKGLMCPQGKSSLINLSIFTFPIVEVIIKRLHEGLLGFSCTSHSVKVHEKSFHCKANFLTCHGKS